LFFSQNNVFLSQQISLQYFSAGLSAQPNGADIGHDAAAPEDGHFGSVHPAYNPSFSACFFSQNSIFLSQQISQQCFSAGLSAQPNEAFFLSERREVERCELSWTRVSGRMVGSN
jgi:hypothetical protein